MQRTRTSPPENGTAPHPGQPCDPAAHVCYTRLAWTLVNRIQSVLRPDEINDCAQQFYLDIREHLEHERHRTR